MPFPTDYPPLALGNIMDKSAGLRRRLGGVWQLGGFALGQLLPDDDSPLPLTATTVCPGDEDKCLAKLEEELRPIASPPADGAAIASINWVFVGALLKKLLALWGM